MYEKETIALLLIISIESQDVKIILTKMSVKVGTFVLTAINGQPSIVPVAY